MKALSVEIYLKPTGYDTTYNIASYDVCAYVQHLESGPNPGFGHQDVAKASCMLTLFKSTQAITVDDIEALQDPTKAEIWLKDVVGLRGRDGQVYHPPLPGFSHMRDYDRLEFPNLNEIEAICWQGAELAGPLQSHERHTIELTQAVNGNAEATLAVKLTTVSGSGRRLRYQVLETTAAINALESLDRQNPISGVLALLDQYAKPGAEHIVKRLHMARASGALTLEGSPALLQGNPQQIVSQLSSYHALDSEEELVIDDSDFSR